MHENAVGDAGAALVAKALGFNTAVKTLRLIRPYEFDAVHQLQQPVNARVPVLLDDKKGRKTPSSDNRHQNKI